MSESKIESADLKKALSALQDLAKGHNSRGTATTEVVSMVGESGSPQVFHTPSNSSPGTWAGSSWEGEDWSDSIGPDGTDYKSAGAKMRKSVMSKISKGLPLTGGEKNFVAKGGLDKFKDAEETEKALPFEKDKDKDIDKAHPDAAEDKKMLKDEIKPEAFKGKDVNKSFADHAAENTAVKGGFEVSEFLAGFASVMHKSLTSMEARITDRVITAISKSSVEQNDVQKSLAEALSSLGEVLAVHSQRIDQVEATPARGAKSIVKSGAAPQAEGTPMSKSMVTNIMTNMVQKGQMNVNEVLKFDATGELSDELKARISNFR